jgi:UDP-glucose 4-epimerase
VITAHNLGLGQGISVKEMLDEFKGLVGSPIDVRERPQRRGDALAVWASNELVVKALAWTPTITLEEMVLSSLQFLSTRGEDSKSSLISESL